ncbi:MAG: hypothetical protein RID91_13180 [Azospirillaceae bacterium]
MASDNFLNLEGRLKTIRLFIDGHITREDLIDELPELRVIEVAEMLNCTPRNVRYLILKKTNDPMPFEQRGRRERNEKPTWICDTADFLEWADRKIEKGFGYLYKLDRVKGLNQNVDQH